METLVASGNAWGWLFSAVCRVSFHDFGAPSNSAAAVEEFIGAYPVIFGWTSVGIPVSSSQRNAGPFEKRTYSENGVRCSGLPAQIVIKPMAPCSAAMRSFCSEDEKCAPGADGSFDGAPYSAATIFPRTSMAA